MEKAVEIAKHLIEKEDSDSPKTQVGRLNEFWWDKLILVVITAIFGVTSVQVFASYITDEGLACFIAENHTSSLETYINELCRESVPIYGKYFQYAIYGEVTLLSALHVLWTLVCGGPIEGFRYSVNSMHIKRNAKTGRFEYSDRVAIQKLERKFDSKSMVLMYLVSKLGQVLVSVLSATLFPLLDFGSSPTINFICTNSTKFQSHLQWPLSTHEIPCTYRELSTTFVTQWLNLIALILIIFLALWGLIEAYVVYIIYNYKKIASFLLWTGLQREHHLSLQWQLFKNSSLRFCKYYSRESPHVSTDLLFLNLRLYGTNCVRGENVTNIIISNHLESPDILSKQNFDISKHFTSKIKDLVQKFVDKNNTLGVLVMSDNNTLSLFFQEYFNKMICFMFNSHITDFDEDCTCVTKKESNYTTMQIPPNFLLGNHKKVNIGCFTTNGNVNINIKVICQREIEIEKYFGDSIPNKADPVIPIFIFGPLNKDIGSITAHRVGSLIRMVLSKTNYTEFKVIFIHPTRFNKKIVSEQFFGADKGESKPPWYHPNLPEKPRYELLQHGTPARELVNTVYILNLQNRFCLEIDEKTMEVSCHETRNGSRDVRIISECSLQPSVI